jgi:phosphinothricin acetyltransferase
MIRGVRLSDADTICRIYNYYIENTVITFEEEKITTEVMMKRIGSILQKKYPYIVYEKEENIIGYAYLNTWRERPAYNITLETSIYMDYRYTGKGTGTLLYSELIERAKGLGLHSIIGCIALPNVTSRRLHERLNFVLAGNFKEVGGKFGKLVDVEFWQLMLNNPDN